MKKIIFTLITLSALSASAEIMFERQLFNARNGETYTCRISKNGGKLITEILNENVSAGTAETKFSATAANVETWKQKMVSLILTPNKGMNKTIISQYVHHGTKSYRLFADGKGHEFYNLTAHVPKQRNKKWGSEELRYSNDGGNTQRLRGEIDVACKNAQKSLRI